MKKDVRFYSGNELVAIAAVDAGCRFYGGYPITPSSEIAETMSKLLPKVGGAYIQMEDEIAAMGTVIGASLAGAKSLTATSGPGFSLKQENLGFAYMAEVPVVVCNVMRGGPSTGLPTALAQADIMQAKWGTHGDHPCITIVPAYLEEVYTLTIKAFNLAEKYRMPVILLLDELIGHLSEAIELPSKDSLVIHNRVKPSVPPSQYFPYDTAYGDVPPMANFFEGYRYHVTGLNHDKTGFPTTNPQIVQADQERHIRKVEYNKKDIIDYESYLMNDAEIAVFAYGSTARGARVAVDKARQAGLKVGLFRPKVLWPLPEKSVQKICERVKAVIVPEMNMGQLIRILERYTAGRTRIYGINHVGGVPIPPEEIFTLIKEVN
ncbi:MAG: 2-oxoacid:acceptor oxidoreductase subunit alpha [Candidatus Delongbacteria bacterium]|nr:2-oxoacid:acceptor oxidoreductase subunit alpha [Candidatus Delongbacteria bacterium]MBN2834295.1 2-oxoacid:acceptor oxidoreductase subunit alpha [Candidatus Delongbacteria bacterium]